LLGQVGLRSTLVILWDSKMFGNNVEYVISEFGLLGFFVDGGVELVDDEFVLFLVEGDF
jgi:hypothetical protein